MALSGAALSEIKKVSRKYNVPYANLAAVVEIESDGIVSALVNGKREPLIRFEGHYFDRRLTGAKKEKARRKGLAHPSGGRIKNPRKQQARWDHLLVPASAIDESAALESCSWGLGQVMGAHWRKLGYKSVQEMVRVARSGVAGQVELMMRYCEKFGLMDELRRGDFDGFGRGYNGKNYKKNKYAIRMRNAARRYGGDGEFVHASGVMRLGSKGADVRELQKLLVRAHYSVKVDGDFGPSTRSAVKKFQSDSNLKSDGLVGKLTMEKLEDYKQPFEVLDKVTVTEAVIETDEGRVGAGACGIGVGTSVVSETVQKATEAIYPITGQSATLDLIYTGLTMASVALILGGMAYLCYGQWKANRKSG